MSIEPYLSAYLNTRISAIIEARDMKFQLCIFHMQIVYFKY